MGVGENDYFLLRKARDGWGLGLWRSRPTLKGWVLIGCGFCSVYGEAFQSSRLAFDSARDATGVLLGKDAKKVSGAP